MPEEKKELSPLDQSFIALYRTVQGKASGLMVSAPGGGWYHEARATSLARLRQTILNRTGIDMSGGN